MTSVEKIQNEIVEELSLFTDWIEKYEYLIELGKDEIDFDKKFMKDEFLIMVVRVKYGYMRNKTIVKLLFMHIVTL